MQADESVLNFKKICQKSQRKYLFIQLKSERKTIRGNQILIRIKKRKKITLSKKKVFRTRSSITMSNI